MNYYFIITYPYELIFEELITEGILSLFLLFNLAALEVIKSPDSENRPFKRLLTVLINLI